MKDKINKDELGKRIKKIRSDLGQTAEVFGKNFDPPANRSLVSSWENGRYVPGPSRVKKIAELADISVDELLYGNINDFVEKVLLEAVDEKSSSYSEELVYEMIEYLRDHENLDDLILSVDLSEGNKIDTTELEDMMITDFLDKNVDEFVREYDELNFHDESFIVNSFINFTKKKKEFNLKSFEGARKHLFKENNKIDPFFYTSASIDELLKDEIRSLHSVYSEGQLIDLFFISKLHEEVNNAIGRVFNDYVVFKTDHDEKELD